MWREYVSAIGITCAEIGNCSNNTKTIGAGLTNMATILTGLVGGLAVIFLLWGAFRYVISRGDPSHIKQAKETVIYSIIGVIVAILGYAIVKLIATSLG